MPDDDYNASVTFAVTGLHRLEDPGWGSITLDDIETLIGGEFDPGRGDGYVPAEPSPQPELIWRIMPVVRFPRPRPFREPACMPHGITRWRRLAWQLYPNRGARSCCWYHGGDWHAVTKAAIRLVRDAKRAGVRGDDLPGWCRPRIKALKLTTWETGALNSLLAGPGVAIDPGRKRRFVNGQHRAQAMLDAGVRFTVVIRLRYPTPSAATASDRGVRRKRSRQA